MIVLFHKNFEKDYQRLRQSEQERTRERIALFLEDPFKPILSNHPLRGKYQNYFSINIGGDLRAIYKLAKRDTAVFIAVNTHSKLYSA